jgi:hypothetical protein
VIAWESAFSGSVLGRPNTGNAPVKDVTVSWYFVSYPDIGGSATTNADGQFVELISKALGVNIQVVSWQCLRLIIIVSDCERTPACFSIGGKEERQHRPQV